MKFLRKLRLNRVDLVPQGANPGAQITLYKSHTATTDGTNSEVASDSACTVGDEVKQEDHIVPTESTPTADAVTAAEFAKAQAEASTVKKQLEATQAELAEVRKAQRVGEFIAKAKAFSALGDPEDIGSVLLAADEHFTDSEKATLDALLKSSAERIEKGDLFTRLSKDASGPESWEQKLISAARDRVAKGLSSTVEQAKVAIMKEDSDLRSEYETSIRSR